MNMSKVVQISISLEELIKTHGADITASFEVYHGSEGYLDGAQLLDWQLDKVFSM